MQGNVGGGKKGAYNKWFPAFASPRLRCAPCSVGLPGSRDLLSLVCGVSLPRFPFSLFFSLDIWSSTLASPARSSNVSFPVLTACRVRRAPRYFGEGEDAVVIPQMCPFPIGEKWGYGEGRENGSHGGCVQHAEMEMGEPLRAHVFFCVFLRMKE